MELVISIWCLLIVGFLALVVHDIRYKNEIIALAEKVKQQYRNCCKLVDKNISKRNAEYDFEKSLLFESGFDFDFIKVSNLNVQDSFIKANYKEFANDYIAECNSEIAKANFRIIVYSGLAIVSAITAIYFAFFW